MRQHLVVLLGSSLDTVVSRVVHINVLLLVDLLVVPLVDWWLLFWVSQVRQVRVLSRLVALLLVIVVEIVVVVLQIFL